MDPHLDVRDFRFFLALATELHFSRAAERLHVAQPHLSAHLRQLEERLDVRLLERTSRSVRLTAAGKQFAERARFVLNQIDETVTVTRRSAEGRQGKVSVAFISSAGFGILPWVLREFRTLHPDVDVALTESTTELQVQGLIEGRLNFGFVRPPVHSRRINITALAREGLVAVLPPTHPLAGRSPLLLEDLAEQEFVGFAPVAGVQFQEAILSYCRRAGFEPRLATEARDTNSVIVLVAAGFGIAILPEWVKETFRSNVIFKTLHEVPPLVDLALAWLPDDSSPASAAFRKVVDSYVAANPVRSSRT